MIKISGFLAFCLKCRILPGDRDLFIANPDHVYKKNTSFSANRGRDCKFFLYFCNDPAFGSAARVSRRRR